MKGILNMTEEYDVGEQPAKKTKIQPKWKNAPDMSDLKMDLDNASDYQEQLRFKLREYEDTREGGRVLKNLAPGKSKSRPKVVRKANEWKYAALEEPFLNTPKLFRVDPANAVDTAAAKQNMQVLNYQWNTKVKKTKLVGDIVRTVVDEGTVIVKTGWDAETDIVKVEQEVPVYADPAKSVALMQQLVQTGRMAPEKAQAMLETGEPLQVSTKTEMVDQEVLVKNQPTYEVCLTANVTIDPTCNGDMDKALFVIHEYDTNMSELQQDEYDPETGEGIYYNLDFVVGGTDAEYDLALSPQSQRFTYADKARKRLRAYEYWGYWDIQGDGKLVSIVSTWIGSTLIRLEENPFSHGRLPFSVATYMPVKKSVHGEPDAELLKENQETIGNMTRAINDTTTRMAAGQEFIDENFFPSPSQKNQYEKGNTVYYRSGFNPKTAVYRSEVQQLGSTPFDVINWQTQDANELSGTKPFGNGNSPKLGGSAVDRNSMDATAKRELSILRRLSDLLFVDMAKMTIAMNQELLSPTEVIRITDDEFVEVKRDDLQGDFDLRVQVSTPEKDDDKATKIMKLMQTNGANMDPKLAQIHYVQLAELWNLDKLASEVENYKPQPNPVQEEIQKLQLEEQKLKNAVLMKELEDYDSKIAERVSRAKLNGTTGAALDDAKAKQALAIADKMASETDILDIAAVRIMDGTERKEAINDLQFSADAKAELEKQKVSQDGLDNLDKSLSHISGHQISKM